MEDGLIQRARQYLRFNHRGDLRFDEHLRQVRYVTCGDGRMVAPVMVAMLQTIDTVLFIPEAVEEAMEVMVSLEQIEEAGLEGARCDRWRIYHGEPEDVRWAILDIDAARFEGSVIDGAALHHPNPLAEDEAAICREMNRSHRSDLVAICRCVRQMEIAEPTMVGIDALGFDVRGRFDVIRISFETPQTSRAAAEAAMEELMEQAREHAE